MGLFIQPDSVIRIRERLFRADEMRNARRIFAVGAGLRRPKLSWLLGAETAPLLNKKKAAETKQFAAIKIVSVRKAIDESGLNYALL